MAIKKIIKNKQKNFLLLLSDLIIFLICLLVVFLMNNSAQNLPLLGSLVTLISIYLCIKVRNNEKLLFLFAIIGFINISLGVSDGILRGFHVAGWQIPLRETEFNTYTMKSIFLLMSIINLFLSHHWINNRSVNLRHEDIKRKNNPIIAYTGICAIYIILFMGYDVNSLSVDEYVSNSNPLIEYAVVVFAVIWFYSRDNTIINVLLKVYSILYILYSMSFGDRSAAFLMILLYYLLYSSKRIKISITQITLLAIIAISISNFIAEFRTDSSLQLGELVQNTFQRGVYSDTVSYSYYTSITLTAVPHVDSTYESFVQYLSTWIIGGGIGEYSNLTDYVKDNYHYNLGGGLYTSYFYYGLGYLGVFIGAILLGFVLRKVYSKSGSLAVMYQFFIPVLSIRWYLYGPTSIYRSIFIISTLLLVLCFVFDRLVSRKKIIKKYN